LTFDIDVIFAKQQMTLALNSIDEGLETLGECFF